MKFYFNYFICLLVALRTKVEESFLNGCNRIMIVLFGNISNFSNKNNFEVVHENEYENENDYYKGLVKNMNNLMINDIDINQLKYINNDNFINEFNICNNELFDIKNKVGKDKINSKKLNALVKSKIKVIEKEKNNKLAKINGGYLNYNQISCDLGFIMDIIQEEILMNRIKNNLICKLEDNKVYSLLLNVNYIKDGHISGISPIKSIIINKNSSIKFMAKNMIIGLYKVINEYNIDDSDCFVRAYWREWITDDNYSKLVKPVDRDAIINDVLKEQAEKNLDVKSKFDKVMKFMNVKHLDNYVNDFPTFDSITNLEKYTLMKLTDFSRKLLVNTKIKLTAYEDKNMSYEYDFNGNVSGAINDQLYFVFDIIPGKKRVVCVGETKTWEHSLHLWNSTKYPYVTWTDEKINNNEFIRYINDYKFHIHNGKVKYWERVYNFQDMIMGEKNNKHDTKIGTLDLETYGSNLNVPGLGELNVYAAGCALNTGYNQKYYLDSYNGLNSGEEIIQKMFKELFDHIEENKKERNSYTLYAHNLGRFDSVFILKSLATAGYKLNGKWRENDLISLKITDIQRKLNVKLLDSLKILPESLNKLLITYGCTINKGMFPHKFINENNLNYIGPKPDIKYYVDEHKMNELKAINYNNLPDLLNVKEQCLDYLDKDVMGLLEIMNKVSSRYYNEYKINITKYPTLPGLSLAIYGYWFKDNKHSIKMIKGPLEKFIRQAYFGGNSNIFNQDKNLFVHEGYHYDMNSQYPNAMKCAMPTGNPVFSNNTDLNYYNLGFVFAKITPPSKDILSNLFIQKRNENGSISCPRETFYEFISTVDLKQGIEYGYKAEVVCGVNFPNACEPGELFGEFVDSLYEIKATATDPILKQVAKLSLNSTYGKFGQKDKEYNIKLVSKDDVEKIISKYHYTYLAEISEDNFIIKSGPRFNEKLRRLYAESAKLNMSESLDMKITKNIGIPSAVQISAMISSYARASINPLKNIPGNLAIASNTDSLILRKPLSQELIGKELGKWKLEHRFKNGVFVRPKLYCYHDFDTNLLIKKASGVDAGKLTYNDYVQLGKGVDILTNKNVFKLNWDKLKIEIMNVETKLNGINKFK